MCRSVRSFLFCLPAALAVAPSPPAAAEDPSPLAAVHWLVGRWEGHGWSELLPGRRDEFRSTEIVESRLDGTAFLIEGIHFGHGPDGEEQKVHHALALLTPSRDGKLAFRSHVLGRGGGNFTAWTDGGTLFWEIPGAGRRGTIRYEIRRDEEGRWVELGTITPADGGEPREMFGMVLERVE